MRWTILLALLALATLGAGSAAADPVVAHFKSPSGNINCIGGTAPAYVECQVRRAAWPQTPPKPVGCDLDWSAHTRSRRVVPGACRATGPRCLQLHAALRAVGGHPRSAAAPR
jgi:hypothetical protein